MEQMDGSKDIQGEARFIIRIIKDGGLSIRKLELFVYGMAFLTGMK
jgi:hypothetical protein